MRCFSSDRAKWSIVSKAAIVTITGLSTYYIYRLVRDYGWNGALRYIWEGDPLPQDIRQYTDTLRNTSYELDEKQAAIFDLEEGLVRARRDTANDSSPAKVLTQWRLNMSYVKQDLRSYLARISHDLDTLVSNVDQVPTREEVRRAKKMISRRIVSLMSRTDRLIEFFTTSAN
jgi:hypothetical protein